MEGKRENAWWCCISQIVGEWMAFWRNMKRGMSMSMCKWNSTAIQSSAKGGKNERNYFYFLLLCWQASHIVPAIEKLKKKEKKRGWKFWKLLDLAMHCQILTCNEKRMGIKDEKTDILSQNTMIWIYLSAWCFDNATVDELFDFIVIICLLNL